MAGHRYWRLNCRGVAGGGFYGAYEIEMRATSGGADQTSPSYAFGDSSYGSTYGPDKAFDNNLSTQWSTSSTPSAIIGQDFGAATIVSEISYTPVTSDTGPANLDIQYSDDNSNWVTTDTYSSLSWPPGDGTRVFSVTADSTPTIVALTAEGIVVASAVGKPVLGQKHALSAISIKSTPTLGSPLLVEGVKRAARPTATDTIGFWLTDSGGTDLYTAIDEASPDDGDFIQSGENPSGDIARVHLGLLTGTNFIGDLILQYRLGKSGTGRIDQTVRLKQGASIIGSWTHSDVGALATYQQTIDPALISDFSDLYVEFEAS